jgi:hypothetical protein
MTATIAFDRRSVELGTATLRVCPAPGEIALANSQDNFSDEQGILSR